MKNLQDKPALFRSFYKWLKPGGKVLISDYCRSAGTPSAEFAEYIKQRGYDLHDVQAYAQVSLVVYSFAGLPYKIIIIHFSLT